MRKVELLKLQFYSGCNSLYLQRILAYFVMGSSNVQLTSCFTCLPSAVPVFVFQSTKFFGFVSFSEWKKQRRIDSSEGSESEDNPHIASPSLLAPDGQNVVNEKLTDFKAGNQILHQIGQCTACERIVPGNLVKLGSYTFEVRGSFDCRSSNTVFVVTIETGEQQSMYELCSSMYARRY